MSEENSPSPPLVLRPVVSAVELGRARVGAACGLAFPSLSPLLAIISAIILIIGATASAQEIRSVDRGLAFLAKAQNTDGSFGTANEINERARITSISLLTFLSAGHAPDLGKYGSAARGATDYLLRAAASDKIAPPVRQMIAFVLNQAASVDDNPADQQRIQQMQPHAENQTEIIPFASSNPSTLKTLHALLSQQQQTQHTTPLSYSTLYRVAILASDLHLDDVSQRIDALLTYRQRPDGSWDGNPETTAFAVLSLTATDRLMAIGN